MHPYLDTFIVLIVLIHPPVLQSLKLNNLASARKIYSDFGTGLVDDTLSAPRLAFFP